MFRKKHKLLLAPHWITESMFHGQPTSIGLWPPRSPYLRQSDFLLRGFLEDSVYPNCPHAMEE